MRTLIFTSAFITFTFQIQAQDQLLSHNELIDIELKYTNLRQSSPDDAPVYQYKWKADIPIVAVGTAWSLYAFTKIYDKDRSTESEIINLRKEDINGFDRWAAGNNSDAADRNSNYLFYGSIPAPFLLFLDKDIRKDAAKVSFLYWESMAITGLFYTGSTYFTNRYRPETYDTKLSVGDRTNGNYRNSFLAGHVALVATSVFFTAKVYGDYHPESKLKWVLYGGAIAATGSMVVFRHVAGKHFPSDLIAGTSLGVLSGLLVPHFHKNKKNVDKGLTIIPLGTGDYCGISINYRF